MQAEYETIIKEGLYLQLDCPDLALSRHMLFNDLSDDDFVKIAELHVETLNYALRNIPNEKVIGLSKINRLVDYYSHRPQVQERLCMQILKDLQKTLDTQDVIVVINAKHLCVSSRGIKDKNSFTTTIEYSGVFEEVKLSLIHI